MCADEVELYISEGLIDNWTDYYKMKSQAKSYLAHHCSERCMRRTGPSEGDVKCHVPDARYLSTDITKFSESEIDVVHTSDVLEVMERLGLCEDLKEHDGRFVSKCEYLKSKRIYAPVRYGEGNISPVIGRLFAATRSTMNVQVCTSSGTTVIL